MSHSTFFLKYFAMFFNNLGERLRKSKASKKRAMSNLDA